MLTDLKTLDLAYNNLSGSIPSWLGLLMALNYLNLDYNRLTGTIPLTLCHRINVDSDFFCNADGNDNPPRTTASIVSYINNITLANRPIQYPSNATAEERALRWLIDDYGNTSTGMKNGIGNKSLLQRYVLATLWFQRSDDDDDPSKHVYYKKTWTTNLDECNWGGVSCDKFDEMTGLGFDYANVQGRIPEDLGLLTRLTYLSLLGNELNGSIPSSLGTLTALTELRLGYNQLAGTIPSSLGSLTALDRLWLSYNGFSGTIPSSLGLLTTLTVLQVADNALTGTIPSSLGMLTALTNLDLTLNSLSGTIPLSLCNFIKKNTIIFDADCDDKVNCTC
jgi:Leucine-rich repeat (LRR) protein